MEDCVIRIEHLKKEYAPGIVPLQDVNAEIRRGEVISILGPSGSGKSTLLRCINRLEKPTAGTITVLGQEVSNDAASLSALRQKVGMVFQSFCLFPHLTVLENICAAPMDLKKMTGPEAEKRARELLRKVGLASKADSYPDELSGGQKQRIAIARALAMEPEILLLDEPTSALDPKMVQEVLFLIERLARTGITMLIVTHEINFARMISSRILFLNEGVIYEEGTPEEIFLHPKQEKTRLFVERFRQFEILLSPDNVDIDDLLIRLEYFIRNNSLPASMITRLHCFLEEAVVAGLLEKRPETGEVQILLQTEKENGDVAASISYGGESFDPLSELDEIALKLVQHAAECGYSFTDGKNQLHAFLKNR